MGVPILGGWGGGADNVGKIPTFYRFLFWRTSLKGTREIEECGRRMNHLVIASFLILALDQPPGKVGSGLSHKSNWAQIRGIGGLATYPRAIWEDPKVSAGLARHTSLLRSLAYHHNTLKYPAN